VAWDTTTLATDGTLRLMVSGPVTSPSVAVTRTESELSISWPTNYADYYLTSQTNPPGQGLTTNWWLVPGVTNNSFTMPYDSNVGSVFFRLTKPQ
jgi:hypothetical protein